MKPRCLDLFCGAGGAAMGLHRAGFDVTGIDIKPQPRYPFRFIQGDALRPPVRLSDFDLVWASPPCQAFSSSRTRTAYPNLIPQTRALVADSLHVIENVPQAPIRRDLMLDGTMFGLKVIRTRAFELGGFAAFAPSSLKRPGLVSHGGYVCVVGTGRPSGLPPKANAWHSMKHREAAMGIDWMRIDELSEAIPPAYSKHIGECALMALESASKKEDAP